MIVWDRDDQAVLIELPTWVSWEGVQDFLREHVGPESLRLNEAPTQAPSPRVRLAPDATVLQPTADGMEAEDEAAAAEAELATREAGAAESKR